MKSLPRVLVLLTAFALCPQVWAKSKTNSKTTSNSSGSSSSASSSSTDSSSSSSSSTSANSSSSNAAKIYTTDESSPLIALANGTATLLSSDKKSSDLDTKITELESAWDAKEKALKPRDEARWTTIDKTLDKAISSIRGSKFDAKKGKEALDSFAKMLTDSTK